MSFLPSKTERIIPSFGDPIAKIAIVGDFTSTFDDRAHRPFAGIAGQVLEQCLHNAGLIKGELYLTNVIKTRSQYSGQKANSEFYQGTNGKFLPAALPHLDNLQQELNDLSANILIAAGPAALSALTRGEYRTATFRGYITESKGLEQVRKVLPTYHPSSTLWGGNYINRHLIVHDLKKAKEESLFSEVQRPPRLLKYEFTDIWDVLRELDALEMADEIACDIEVLNYEVSYISLSHSPNFGLAIPFDNRWSAEEETLIWRSIQRILGNPQTNKVFQNGIFDIHFLLTRNGIVTRGPINDTMIGHSVMFPELPKGLGFLGSLYCGSQEYWKNLVKFENIKGDS